MVCGSTLHPGLQDISKFISQEGFFQSSQYILLSIYAKKAVVHYILCSAVPYTYLYIHLYMYIKFNQKIICGFLAPFHPTKGPPFGFSLICLACIRFSGVYFRIQLSSFPQASSLCYIDPTWDYQDMHSPYLAIADPLPYFHLSWQLWFRQHRTLSFMHYFL